MCGDGTCIPKVWACDGFTDCTDGLDENAEFCATCPFQFLCTNGRCVDPEFTCDGINHCRDNSDENKICVGQGESQRREIKLVTNSFWAGSQIPVLGLTGRARVGPAL